MAWVLALGALGCSADEGAGNGSREEQAVAAPPEPETTDALDTTGMTGDEAQADLEYEGLSVTFDPEEPADPAACTVDDQYPIGEVDPGSDITLTVTCEVADVTGLDGQSAIDELETAGFTWYVDDCYDAPEDCTVADQDFFEADPGEEIGLRMEPPDDYSGDYGESSCHESYPDDCLDPNSSDYDCDGGEGDGPDYVVGPITVDHSVADPDPFELDRDLDGSGCDSY